MNRVFKVFASRDEQKALAEYGSVRATYDAFAIVEPKRGASARLARRFPCEDISTQYMRANNSNYGILVVCTSGKKKGWRNAAGKKLGFDQMVGHLADHARKVLAATRGIVDVRVVVLDFR